MIDTIVIHYSATYPDQDITAADVTRWHLDRGFRTIGYHWFIRRDGTLEEGREEGTQGAGVRGHNGRNVLHICWAGGIDRATGDQVGVWNITEAQESTLVGLINNIQKRHPKAKRVIGHRNLAATECPGRDDVAVWWESVGGKARKLSESRTIQGSGAAAVGTIGATATEVAQEVFPLVPYVDSLKYVFVVLTLIGIGYAIYARKDDWDRGRK